MTRQRTARSPYMRNPMPPSARAIVEATAEEYQVPCERLFDPWPQRRRSPEVQRAFEASIQRLSEERLDERYRYGIAEIAGWFGIARKNVNVHRAKASSFEPRFRRQA